MENQIQIFNNPEFGTIRTILINGEIWFVGKDVTNSLAYSNAFAALKQHVDDEDKKVITRKEFEEMALNKELVQTAAFLFGAEFGGTQRLTFINESGLYSLIFSSKLPKTKEFKHWVTSEVLPSIRKLGIYTTQEIINKIFDSAKAAETIQNLKCVYVFEMNNDTVKIGYTQNVRQRMNTIISSSGLDIVNFYHTDFIDSEIAYLIEQTCHANFDSCRVRGEFFCVSFEEACLELDKIFKEFYKFGKT
jgi:prophage antirepressor-like protein